jgi:predicted transcriptional regulator
MPITLIFSFIQKFWLPILVTIVVGYGVWYVNNLRNTVESQKRDIAELQVQKAALQASNDQLAASIQVSNAAINEIRKLAPNTKQEFAKLQATVSSQSDALAARIKQILADKKPQTCEETIHYLINAQGEYKR